MEERYSGILLHPVSLPGKYGIGSLGDEAHRFVDWLADSGQKIWQILPLGPTNWSHSPYQCYSAFAGNPDLIDLDGLIRSGWLKPEEVTLKKPFPLKKIDYNLVRKFRDPLLMKAFHRFRQNNGFNSDDYLMFWNEHSWWLESWSLFYACRKNMKGKDWSYWDEHLIRREDKALISNFNSYRDDVEFQRFLQFIFLRQWLSLKKYANDRNVKIFGDLPLYVAYDSSDVWANQDIFLLDNKRKPLLVGGVPPDYFSKTGQLWGNPIYDWDRLQQRNYDWWMARIHYNLRMFDLLRIDHFRGLESFWAVPYGEKTAVKGEWLKARGEAILRILQSQLGHLPIIAEDLGMITGEVHELRMKYHLPGMKVLQFAFTHDAANEHLPHNYHKEFVVYTGTHDNDTTIGWLKTLNRKEASQLKHYLGAGNVDHWKMIRSALCSVAQIAIIPMQDILGLDSSARMNTPGTIRGNWQWRLSSPGSWEKEGQKLRDLTLIYGR
jgi:4-alpha-glucanotransferase